MHVIDMSGPRDPDLSKERAQTSEPTASDERHRIIAEYTDDLRELIRIFRGPLH
jgi:hypothetical protein